MTAKRLPFAFLWLWAFSSATVAAPFVPAGDIFLRDDIQRLADYGVISSPTSTWPMSWGPILADLEDNRDRLDGLPADVAAAFVRVHARANSESRVGQPVVGTALAVTDNPITIRSFRNTPRADVELAGIYSWLGERFSIDLQLTEAGNPEDGQNLRADNSALGMVVGNYTIALSTQERWWGPGWDGSLILSNSARPFPAVTIDRNFTQPFESRWLSWIGPWDLSIMMGQLESDRFVPNALFFGMRVAFRPAKNWELGITRAAQWCGDGRPCDASTFKDLLLGKDNLGTGNVTTETEPGNQLAGLDFRYTNRWTGQPVSLYGQFIGEDEAGGLPSRFLGLVGAETSGIAFGDWSYRAYTELAITSCSFASTEVRFDCAYTHGIYQTGYRYRGRAIGHALDADARVGTAGLVLALDDGSSFHALLRHGALNRGTLPDPNHTQSRLRKEISSIDLSYRREFRIGQIEVGAGYQRLEDDAASSTDTQSRLYLGWRKYY